MAFPVVAATNESSTNTAGTSHTVNLPANIAAGDLLIVCLDKGSTAATVNALAGWNELLDENSGNGLYIAWHKADGTEGSTITLTTSANTRSAEITFRITGAQDPTIQPPEIGSTSSGTSATPDPPATTPTGGTKDYLWIAVAGMAGEEADDDTWSNTPPTSFTPSPPLQKSCGTAGTNLGGLITAASLQAAASSQDPGTFGVDVSAAWRAQTIAIHPAPVLVDGTSTITATGTGTAAGDRPISGTQTTTASLTGSAGLDLPSSGNLTATGTLAGSALLEVGLAGNLTATATLAGDAEVVTPAINADGDLSVAADVAGTAALVLSSSGDSGSLATLTGSAALALFADGDLATAAALTATAAADHPVDGDPLIVTATTTGTALLEIDLGGDTIVVAGLTADAEVETPGLVNITGALSITATASGEAQALHEVGIDGILAAIAILTAVMRSRAPTPPTTFISAKPAGHVPGSSPVHHLAGVEPVVVQRSGVS